MSPERRTRPIQAKASPRPASSLVVELEPLLDAMIVSHDELLGVAAEHRRAIARADGPGVEACNQRRHAAAERLRELDRRRAALVPGTITTLAAALEEPGRSRLLERASALVDRATRLRREHATIRAATESLIAHMEGLMSQVARRLSDAGTYSRRGALELGAPIASGIDLRR